MNSISFENPVTADGQYAYPPVTPGKRRIIELSGTFGGGTVTLGYVSPSGDFIAYKVSTGGADITTTFAESWTVDTPSSGRFAISVTGSTSPSLKLITTPIY